MQLERGLRIIDSPGVVFDDDDFDGRGGARDARGSKSRTVGVLERRANVTVVGGEIVISKEARGDVKVCSLCFCCELTY